MAEGRLKGLPTRRQRKSLVNVATSEDLVCRERLIRRAVLGRLSVWPRGGRRNLTINEAVLAASTLAALGGRSHERAARLSRRLLFARGRVT
jgi:hypothetical protein